MLNNSVLFKLVISSILLGVFALLVSIGPSNANILGKEDGLVETLSALFNGMSAAIMIYLFVRSKSPGRDYIFNTKRNYFFLLLGLLFIFFMGEEISWGQRLFNYATPDWLSGINNQQEFNLHNLNFIEASEQKTGLARWATAGRVFTLFWSVYCLILPVLNKYFTKVRQIIIEIHLPIIPIWLGILFLLNYLIGNLLEEVTFIDLGSRYGEYIEMNFAILFFASCLTFIHTLRARNLQKLH